MLSWQAGAPVDTVKAELRDGLEKIGAAMPDEWTQQTAERISKADPAQK